MITTVAGIGGGITLIAILSGFLDPKDIVGLTAPVLAVGNVSRAALFRDELDVDASRWVLAGVVPATLAGSLLLPSLPARAIQVGMALLLLGFVAWQLVRRRRTGARSRRDGPIAAWSGLPVGVVLGGLSATVGGAGPIGAPYFSARGLTRGAFAATSAVCNGTAHAIKSAVFLATGLLAVAHLPASLVAAVTVTIGNRLGKGLLGRMSEATFVRLLLLAITVAAVRLLLVA